MMSNELDPAPQSIVDTNYFSKNIQAKEIQEKKDLSNLYSSTNIENGIGNTFIISHELLYKKRGRKNKQFIPTKKGPIVHNKYSDDNLKRKVKTHYHNFIIAFLNMKARHILQVSLKFGKISSDITKDITIDFNQKLFDKKIKDIVSNVSDKYQNKNKNKFILYLVMNKSNQNSEIMKILNLSYKDMYINYYLKSTKQLFEGQYFDESYEEHLIKLEKKFGIKYALDYKRNAESFISFFYICQKRVRKKNPNHFEKIISPTNINKSEKISKTFNIINYIENKNNIFNEETHKYLISTSTQTEMNIGDED